MDNKRTRLDPETRRQQILDAAVSLAVSKGIPAITREAVAKVAGVAATLVGYYFNPVSLLVDEVILAAIERDIPEIVAYGIAMRHPLALAAPAKIRMAAAIVVAGGGE